MIVRKRKREKMGVRQPTQIESPGHLAWLRGSCQCLIAGKAGHVCSTKMEAHHVREGADGGMGMKPGDDTAVPLCADAHAEGHRIGWRTFEARYGVDMDKAAEAHWKASTHRHKALQHLAEYEPHGPADMGRK